MSIQTFLSRSEWEVLLALPRVLRARPELRAALDDAATVTRLANEIAQWRPALQPHELGGMRRGTIEVQTAMRSLGYVHALGRPLPGDHLPGLDDTVTATRRALDANPYARPELVDEDELRHIVRRDFLDIEPFPFVALVEFAHGRT